MKKQGAKKNGDSHGNVVVQQEDVPGGLEGALPGATTAPEEPPATTPTTPKRRTRKEGTRSNGAGRKRSGPKPDVEALTEELAANCEGMRDRLQQTDQAIQAGLAQSQGLQGEVSRAREQFQAVLHQAGELEGQANQLGEQLVGLGRDANEQSGAALQQVREARQEADLVRYEAGQVRLDVDAVRQTVQQMRQDAGLAHEQTEQIRHALEQARQQQDEAVRGVRQSLSEMEETLARLQQERQRHDEASRQLEARRQQLTQTQLYLEIVRQECQEASQTLLDEIRQQREAILTPPPLPAGDLEQAEAQIEGACAVPGEPVVEQPIVPPGTLPATTEGGEALTTRESVEHEAPVEAGAGQQDQDDAPVVRASVRPETPRERILRHLEQAWAVKVAVADALQSMADEVVQRELRAALAAQRELTQKQKQELEERLRVLGGEPRSSSVLQRLVGWMWESWQREPDDYDRALQDLVKAITAQQAEGTIARILEVLAATGEDVETAELARRQGIDKQAAVEQLQSFVPSLSELAVRLPAGAMAAAQGLLVEAGVIEPAPQPEAPADQPAEKADRT
jgi:chromosome segregation ATPase